MVRSGLQPCVTSGSPPPPERINDPQIPLTRQKKRNVLVQREMERGLSPLVSLARAMAVARQNATETGTRKEGTKAATGFERRSGWGHNVARYTKSFRPRPGVRLDLTALAILVCLGHLARNGRVLNRGCAAYFPAMTLRGPDGFSVPIRASNCTSLVDGSSHLACASVLLCGILVASSEKLGLRPGQMPAYHW